MVFDSVKLICFCGVKIGMFLEMSKRSLRKIFLSLFNYPKFVYSKISPYIWHRKINNNYKQTIKNN